MPQPASILTPSVLHGLLFATCAGMKTQQPFGNDTATSVETLRQNDMMAHLLDALERGQDIGHYGRLVFAMVARHFMSEEQVIEHLRQDRNFSAEDARNLIVQVQGADYNPPRPQKIAQWQAQQEFTICPNLGDPDGCNVYKNLQFPEEVYQSIAEY